MEPQKKTTDDRARPAAAQNAPPPPAPAIPHLLRRVALAASFFLAVGAFLVWRVTQPAAPVDTVRAALVNYEAAQEHGLPVGSEATEATVVEARWQRGGISFPARVLDLSAKGIRLVGGEATRLAGRLAARTDYRSVTDLYTYWMYEGRFDQLPPATERRRQGPFEFRIYRRGATTLVFWQEGEVVSAFAGSGDPETVTSLATSQARQPA